MNQSILASRAKLICELKIKASLKDFEFLGSYCQLGFDFLKLCAKDGTL